MTTSIPVAAFRYSADGSQAIAETKKIGAELRSTGNISDRLGVSLAALGGALSAGAFVSFVKTAADAADALGKASDRLGIASEALSVYQLAARQSGASTEDMNKALEESQKRLGDALRGSGEAAKALDQLGLSARDLAGLAPDELFRKYAQEIGQLSSRAEQASVAQALFGKGAKELLPLLIDGGAALDEAAAFSEKFGLALNRVEIRRIENANDALDRLGEVSSAAGQRIAVGLSPLVEFFADKILGATGNTKDLQAATEAFSAVAITTFEIVANAARSLEAAFFGIAAAGARVLQAVTFGDVSQAFASSVDANLEKANEALRAIKSIEQIQAATMAALDSSRQRAAFGVASTGPGLGNTSLGSTEFSADPLDFSQLEMQLQVETDLRLEFLNARISAENEAHATMLNSESEFHRNRLEQHIAAEEAILSTREGALNAAAGLLQVFAGKSKAAAIALVAINKAQAIALAIQNTIVGSTLQLSMGDPYTALARAAAVKIWGATQVALIAATGIAEVAQIASSGGAAPGSSVNPIHTQPSASSSSSSSARSNGDEGRVVQLVVNGNVYSGRETVDFFVQQLQDRINEYDTVIINPKSRQAQELAQSG